jgi:hypothetical protein
MHWRLISTNFAIILCLASCHRRPFVPTSATGDGATGITYLFFDDFNRSDETFSSNTNYTYEPSGNGVEVHDQMMRNATGSGSVNVVYATPILNASVGVTATAVVSTHTTSPFVTVVQLDNTTIGSAVSNAICGFAFEDQLRIFMDGASVQLGATTFTFDPSDRVVLLMTVNGANYTCTAVHSSGSTETLTYTRPVSFTGNYFGTYFGDFSQDISFDDFGIYDVAANSHRLRSKNHP